MADNIFVVLSGNVLLVLERSESWLNLWYKRYDIHKCVNNALIGALHKMFIGTRLKICIYEQLGVAANFDDPVKGDRRQIRRPQMFIKLALEFGCDMFMSHTITRSLSSKLR